MYKKRRQESATGWQNCVVRPTTSAEPKAALLSCHPSVGRPPPPCLHAKRTPPCEIVRTRLKPVIAASARATWKRTDRRHAMVLSLDVQSWCWTLAAHLLPDC